jgi:N-acetylmuramoyl-L-alanine amidase
VTRGALLWLCALLWALAYDAQGATIAGQEYLPLRSAAQQLGFRAERIDEKIVRLSAASQQASFTLHQRSATIGGVPVWLSFPIAEKDGLLYISRLDQRKVLQPLLKPCSAPTRKTQLRHIVIDPGHGGRDTGARNTTLRLNEKTLTLDLAKRIRQELESLGYKVSLTRSTDRFVELRDRAQIANRLKADLFISIHFNAATDKSVRGIETFIYTPQNAPSSSRTEVMAADRILQPANSYDTESLWAGYDIQRSLINYTRANNRGVRRARFAVLEGLQSPGVLVEGGFVSSPSEGSSLSSALYRQQLAEAIVAGVKNYHKRLLENIQR